MKKLFLFLLILLLIVVVYDNVYNTDYIEIKREIERLDAYYCDTSTQDEINEIYDLYKGIE